MDHIVRSFETPEIDLGLHPSVQTPLIDHVDYDFPDDLVTPVDLDRPHVGRHL